MRTGRTCTNKMTRNRFPVQKKMLERRNKPNESLIIHKNWTKYKKFANSKIKMTLISVRFNYVMAAIFFTCEESYTRRWLDVSLSSHVKYKYRILFATFIAWNSLFICNKMKNCDAFGAKHWKLFTFVGISRPIRCRRIWITLSIIFVR